MSRFIHYSSFPPAHPSANAPPSYPHSGPTVPRRPLPPQTHADYPRPHSLPQPTDHRFTVCMDSPASMIPAQTQHILEALAPHFASMRAEIDSLKRSIDHVHAGSVKVQQDVSKVQHDVSKISSDVSNISQTLSTIVRAQHASVAANPSDTPLDVRSSRGQAKSQGPMPSTDVEMMDNAVRYDTQTESISNVRTTPAHLSPPISIHDPHRANFATSPIQRQWNSGLAPGRFSKADWGNQVPAASQSTPAPTRQFPARNSSSRGSSTSPLAPHVDDKVNNSSPHPSISDEPNEIRQLPSPPEIPTHSQSEEAFVQSQLRPDSQSPSQSMHRQRQAETHARPVNIGKCTLPPSSSISRSVSGSTGLFSPISPQVPALSGSETLERIFDLLQRKEEGMPIVSFAIGELPDLQYPSQPGMEEEENGGEKSGAVDKGRDGGNVETSLDEELIVEGVERVGVAHGQSKQQFDDEDPFAMSPPPPPLVKETREPKAKEELRPQKSLGKKIPLFLPESEPPSVKSMSPAPVIPVRRTKSPIIVDASQVVSSHSRQPYHDHEDEVGELHQEAKSPDSSQDIRRPLISSSDEVEVQLTTLSEIESSEESSDGEDDGEEMDELLSSQEDDSHSRSSHGIDHEKEGFETQPDLERMLLTGSQRREEVDEEIMEEVHRGVEPESGSQVETARMLIPESQMQEEDKETTDGVREEIGGGPELGTVEEMLIPRTQMREEVEDGCGGIDETMGDVQEEGEVEIASASQIDVTRTLLPESQMREEGTMGDVREETGPESEPGTQVDLPGMLIPQSQIDGETGGDGGDESMGDVRQEAGSGGREEMEVTRREPSGDIVPPTMDANPRGDDIPMTIESSINTFTPRKEVRDPIEEQRQGQGEEELDRQMQVDDDGSQPQFENYHHETDHLSPDLSYQNGLEESSSGQQLHDSVQSVELNLAPDNDEVEPLSPPPHDAPLESSVELAPPPLTQAPDNNLLRESGTGGVMPPSPSDSIAPMASTQARNHTQRAEPVTPIALPEYISPVNSPSPSKSPLPTLARGRKRKFQEMRMQSLSRTLGSGSGGGSGRRGEQIKQVQLVTPTRDGREKRRMLLGSGGASVSTSPDGARNASKVGSGSGKRMQQQSLDVAKLGTLKRNRLGLTMNLKERNGGMKKGEGRSEENPICLSSTPSTPTDEVGDEPLLSKGKGKEKEKGREDPSDCIDLTGSPVSRGTKAAEAVEGQGNRKGKEKEKDIEKDKRQDKKEEEKRKKKEKEKKMMPVGTEDSDDAEVIPARAFKAPKAVAESASDGEHSNQQQNGKKANGATRVPILNLNGIRDRHNKAMTKVKRKTRPLGAASNAPASTQKKVVDRDEEPPLKRARGRSDDSNAVPGAASSKGRTLRKEPPAGTPTTKTKWPQKGAAKSSDRNFVSCDVCSMWYHYGCVGVSMGDDRLKDDVNFICPPCSATGARSRDTGEGQKSKRQSASRKNSASEICARPDCSFKDSSDDREFWVNRIVGRKVKAESGKRRVEVYLVEWEGYRLQEATWQEEDTMGNPAELIAEFVLAARKEGIDLDRDPNRTVLLKDARAVGWTTEN